MERIDKIISSQGSYSRSDVKKLIQQKRVKIDGKVVLKSDIKIDKYLSEIKIDEFVPIENINTDEKTEASDN